MPGILRLSVKEANDLVDLIEEKGGNPDSLRSAIKDVSDAKNAHSSVPAGKLSDEEYLAEKRAQIEIEEGKDLECMICHDKFDHLLSGTCEVCFREWML
ncbi:unnamed protein product, partial [marine sediment metagenome]